MKSKHTRTIDIFKLTGNVTSVKLWLRRSVQPHLFIAALFTICIGLASCEKDIDIKVRPNKPMLVVEGYINNEMSLYNYVVLTRSLDYLSLDFQSTPVSNAIVTVTEGKKSGNNYSWDSATKVRLYSLTVPGVPRNLTNVYLDPRLVSDRNSALLGTTGKSYLLEITEGDNYYSAITSLLEPVQIDSLTQGYSYIDKDDGDKQKFRITNHFKDPDTLNNTLLTLYRFSENRNRFGWGSLFGLRNSNTGTDELTNGEYMHITHPRGYVVGDTVTYHMASVTRDVFNFWLSFNNARNNGGPFATPVTLTTNITGPNVTGCFSGMSLSSRTIIIK